MRTAIGCPIPLELAASAPPGLVERLTSILTDLHYRSDSATKAGAFASAVSLAPSGKRFSIDDLAQQLQVDHEVTSRQVRHLLDGGGFKEDDLRLELIRNAAPDAHAVVLERRECWTPEGRPYDVTTVCLVGPDFAVPVGWLRLWGPNDFKGEEGPTWDSVDHDGALSLLRDFRADLEELGLVSCLPPLISFDCTHGQCERLRGGVADLGFEYLLEVGPRYIGYESADPEDPQRPRRRLHEKLPFRSDEPVPEPQPHGVGEFIAPYHGDGPSYAIGSAGLIGEPGELTGHRFRRRVAELAQLAGSIVRPEAARRLRVCDFEHRNDRGLVVAATILSAYSAILEGRFSPAAPC